MKNDNFTFTKLFRRAALLLLSLAVTGSMRSQCNASFTHTVGANGKVNFTSTSTIPGSPKFYQWNFGDGTTGLGMNVNHTYTSAGIYMVSHYSGDSLGCFDMFMDSVYIVNPPPCTASVSFNLFKDTTQTFVWFGFANYPPNVSSVNWSWGDGSSSNGLFPAHTYSAAGFYSICLTITVSCGATASYCANTYINRSAESAMISVNILDPTGATGIKKNGSVFARANIAPNPVSGRASINLHSEIADTYKIALYTITGKLVLSDELQAAPGSTTKELDMSALESGLYFLSLSNATDHKTLRIVKE